MKAYDLVLYVLFITVVISMVDGLGMFPTHLAIDDETEKIRQLTGFDPSGDITKYEEQYSMGSMLVSGLQLVTGGLLGTIWIAPVLFNKLGMPLELVSVIQIGIWVIYFLGGIQLLFNRSIKHYE